MQTLLPVANLADAAGETAAESATGFPQSRFRVIRAASSREVVLQWD